MDFPLGNILLIFYNAQIDVVRNGLTYLLAKGKSQIKEVRWDLAKEL